MEKGICYGVSVGPGDPELLTIKSIRILKSADIIFLPSAPKENCRVYNIIRAAVPEIDESKYVCVETHSMDTPSKQNDRYDTLANSVSKLLDEGKNVAFPALGEVCLYSTYFYVNDRLTLKGYKCSTISGVSSVQECANRFGISLAQDKEHVHIFPDTENITERLSMAGTKVFMKPKGNLAETVDSIRDYVRVHQNVDAVGISNCGRSDEIVANHVDELCNLKGYMTVIIVKEK